MKNALDSTLFSRQQLQHKNIPPQRIFSSSNGLYGHILVHISQRNYKLLFLPVSPSSVSPNCLKFKWIWGKWRFNMFHIIRKWVCLFNFKKLGIFNWTVSSLEIHFYRNFQCNIVQAEMNLYIISMTVVRAFNVTLWWRVYTV